MLSVKLQAITLFAASIASCGSMQQMHDASITPVGEKQSVVGLTVSPSVNSDTDEAVVLGLLQYNARRGIGESVDFGYHIHVPLAFGIRETELPPVQPLLPAVGADLKFQAVNSDTFDLALNAGVSLSFVSSVNLGVIVSNKDFYASIFNHYVSIPDFTLGETEGDKDLVSGISLTLGYKADNLLYELRIPFFQDVNGEDVKMGPIFSVGVKL